jgi:hypothetical protein
MGVKSTRLNLLGRRFGRLTVVADVGNDGQRSSSWRCLCECGGSTISRGSNLINGSAQSCGCLRTELVKKAREQDRVKRYAFEQYLNGDARDTWVWQP